MRKEKRRLFFWILLVGFFFFSLGFVNALVVNEGQNVKISVSGLSCNSKTANLVYYEVDSNGDDLIPSGSYGLPTTANFDSSGNINFIWNAFWFEDIDSSDGNNNNNNNNNNPDIKFRVECDGSSKESSVLEVLKGEGVECTSDYDCASSMTCQNSRCVSGCVDSCSKEGFYCESNGVYECKLNLTTSCYYKTFSNYCGFKEICLGGSCINEFVSSNILFQDNFNDGNYNSPDTSLLNGLSWNVVSGKASVVNSLGLQDSSNSTVISSQLMPSSYTLEADFSLNYNHWAGIIFGYIDSNNYYSFGITGSSNAGIYRVMNGVRNKLNDGVWDSYYSLAHTNNAKERYKVYFENTGSEIKISVGRGGYSDGLDYEIEIRDTNLEAVSKFKQSKVGFYELSNKEGYVNVYVDNVVIYQGKKQNQRVREKRDFYVSVSGNDNNLGTSSSPFRTIQKASNEVFAGETVYISPGTYREYSVIPKYSGSLNNPITFKSLDPNNKAVFTGTQVIPLDKWSSYNSNIYKTIVNWKPNAVYLNQVSLFFAQEPNQENPNDQLETKYFYNLTNENNDVSSKTKYSFTDSVVFSKLNPNNWLGSKAVIYDSYLNSMGQRDILSYLPEEKRLIVGYDKWATLGDSLYDRYAIRNNLAVLDKPGEFVIDAGRLKVNSWKENSDKTVDISLTKISGTGSAKSIKFYLINETLGVSMINSIPIASGETKNYKLNLTTVSNLIYVEAIIEEAEFYEVYVWPYSPNDLDELELSKGEKLFDFKNYNEYFVIDDLEVRGYIDSAIDFSASRSSRFGKVVNCDIHHNGAGVGARCDIHAKMQIDPNTPAICGGLIVENSTIHHHYGNGVSFGGGRNFTVKDCVIYTNANNGIWAGNGANTLYVVWDVYVLNNYVYDHGSSLSHADGVQFYKTHNGVIDGNLLVQLEGHQNTWLSYGGPLRFTNNIVIGGPAGINSANETYFYNNVFYDSSARFDSQNKEIIEPISCVKGIVKNNIFINGSYNAPPEILKPFYNFSHNFYSSPTGTVSNALGYDNIIEKDQGNLNIYIKNVNSLFSLINNLNQEYVYSQLGLYFKNKTGLFELTDNSPLKDIGEKLDLSKDYKLNKRYQGLGIDFGAVESFNQYSYLDCSNGIKDGNEQGIDCGGYCVQDFDKDGYSIGYCSQSNNFDCNDNNYLINPSAIEICDAYDNNCDGIMHSSYYVDSDKDGKNNCIDNCPNNANALQEDFDIDGIGDLCDGVNNYYEDFDSRFLNDNLLGHKYPNDFTWKILSGSAVVSSQVNPEGYYSNMLRVGNFANKSFIITDQKFLSFNLSYDFKKRNHLSRGLLFLAKDDLNYYILIHSTTSENLLPGITSLSSGAVYKVVNNVTTLVDSNSSLGVGGDYDNHFNISTKFVNGALYITIKRDNLKGNIYTDTFIDPNPAFSQGSIGFYHAPQQYEGSYLDNIVLDSVK